MAPPWLTGALGWKDVPPSLKGSQNCVKLFGKSIAPNTADIGNTNSLRLAAAVYDQLGISRSVEGPELAEDEAEGAASDGITLERLIAADIEQKLYSDPRQWLVTRSGDASDYLQFKHLKDVQQALESPAAEPLRAFFQNDYHVKSDVFVGVEFPAGGVFLHAAIASKWTIRSDRVQNVRQEFATLVRNRRGRLPHLVLVTAEPVPSRLDSIAKGSGEVDGCYLLVYDELDAAVEAELPKGSKQRETWRVLKEQGRIKPYEQLPTTLRLT